MSNYCFVKSRNLLRYFVFETTPPPLIKVFR